MYSVGVGHRRMVTQGKEVETALLYAAEAGDPFGFGAACRDHTQAWSGAAHDILHLVRNVRLTNEY